MHDNAAAELEARGLVQTCEAVGRKIEVLRGIE
jgi:hypothetical protein